MLHTFWAFAASTDAGAASHSSEHMVAIFILEITLMLFVGRLLGEVMQRVGQPAVMGQLLAGILIGPSVLGAFFPALHKEIFPNIVEQKKMIDAISQLGILMLLLLTGMETDLALVKRMRRTAFFSSLGGIVLPFACGFTLGQLLPVNMLPHPESRLVTSLFLATALSISSVKIVAVVIMEVGFMRRNIGQIILSSAILDDTIGWIIIAIVGGLAAQGTVNLAGLSFTVLGTIGFLVFSFTVGRRLVANVIRWTNDHMTIEMPVITAILILMFLAALLTDYIGVHTVLGAFVVGILIGQSPILTRHIEEQFRGLIVALFAPVFFAVAGLSIDLRIMGNAQLLKLAVGLIAIASFGKLVGCYVGGRLGRLSSKEATALAIGMNARGSTEVIVATIGLSMGVLTKDIFTLIVVMAITTTMVTPPLLRWALTRIPPTGEEDQRLQKEAAEANDFVPSIERLLITVDESADGKLASMLAGLFAGTRKLTATVLELGDGVARTLPSIIGDQSGEIVKMSLEFASRNSLEADADNPHLSIAPTKVTTQTSAAEISALVLNEAKKGYDMLFLGVEHSFGNGDGDHHSGAAFNHSIEKIIRDFKGALAIVMAKGTSLNEPLESSFNILVPTTGTDYSRRAAEIAISIAKACGCGVTAMHVSPPPEELGVLRRPRESFNMGRALVKDIQAIGQREGVDVKTLVKVRRTPEAAILRQIKRGHHNLVVLGVKVRPGDKLFFGHSTTALLERTPCPLVVVNS
ncbi:MAG: cation:proton antiporter [Pyrinomonadaceae bacterium]